MKPQAVKFLLSVENMERALAFYRDAMGFHESFSSPDWSELTFGDAILALHGGGEAGRRETGLSIQYPDVQAAFEAALAAGAGAVQAPQQRKGESIILSSLQDPEGNLIMLAQYLSHDH